LFSFRLQLSPLKIELINLAFDFIEVRGKNKNKNMEELKDTSQATPQMDCVPSKQISEMEFDASRAFILLTSMLILPVFLSLSVVSYSLGAII